MNTTVVIIDFRAPQEAIEKLQTKHTVFQFNAQNITYDAVCGHPDIFIFQDSKQCIIAPNTPKTCISFLENHNIKFIFGDTLIGKELHNTTAYNCVCTETHLIHKHGFTDKKILELHANKTFISVPQAYTRCSLMAINSKTFITSDKGIEKELNKHDLHCIFINPETIILPPYKNGFIGGCMGIYKNELYILGNLQTLPEHKQISQQINLQQLITTELHSHNLYDGGGLFFIEENI